VKNGEKIDCKKFKAKNLDDESDEENPDEQIVIQGSSLQVTKLKRTVMCVIQQRIQKLFWFAIIVISKYVIQDALMSLSPGFQKKITIVENVVLDLTSKTALRPLKSLMWSFMNRLEIPPSLLVRLSTDNQIEEG
jgi:hypothetical protein